MLKAAVEGKFREAFGARLRTVYLSQTQGFLSDHCVFVFVLSQGLVQSGRISCQCNFIAEKLELREIRKIGR